MTGKLIIFWDYELQKGLDKSMSGIQATGYDEYNQTEKILDLHKKYDVPGVFATVGFLAQKGDLPYHAPAQVKRIAKEGHEVASHSFEHELLCELSPKQIYTTAKKSKEILEKVSKQEVTTFVPPHNMPFLAYGMSIYQKPGRLPQFSKVSLNQVLAQVRKAGYETYRLYEISMRSKFFNVPLVRDVQKRVGLKCLMLSATGFAEKAKRAVEMAMRKDKIAVVYGHPHSTLDEGSQSLENFEEFLDFVLGLKEKGRLEVLRSNEL